jgi:HEAT repeat protein
MSDNFRPNIWHLQAQADVQGLIKALHAKDATIRRRAAAALRTIGAKDAIPALKLAMMNEPDPDVHVAMAAALEAITEAQEEEPLAPTQGEEVFTQLLQQLKSKSTEDVTKAARELGELKDKRAVEPLVVLFNDTSGSMQVRLAVAEALLKLESAPVEVALLANLRSPEWETRRKAAAILGQLKATWAVTPLAQALLDPHPMVKKTAMAALKHIGTPDARRALGRLTGAVNGQQRTSSTDDTMPAAPRSGLLKRFQKDDDAPETATSTQETPPIPSPMPAPDNPVYTMPTQPLDPEVLKKVEERRRQQQSSTPPDKKD